MPHRQTTVVREAPLFLVPPMIMNKIRKYGESMERIIVRKSGSHFYNISIRTRPVKRELAVRETGAPASAAKEET